MGKCLIFLGSARRAKPFWGGLPQRTGDRIVKLTQKRVAACNEAGKEKKLPPLDIEVMDPLDYPTVLSFESMNGNPSYYHAKDAKDWPEDIQKLVSKVEAADCFIIVCPEYNHPIAPMLTNF